MIEKLRGILQNITDRELIEFPESISLFSNQASIKARELVYFFLEIEKLFGVTFDADKLNNPNFYTLMNIAKEIEEKGGITCFKE